MKEIVQKILKDINLSDKKRPLKKDLVSGNDATSAF